MFCTNMYKSLCTGIYVMAIIICGKDLFNKDSAVKSNTFSIGLLGDCEECTTLWGIACVHVYIQ